MIIVSGAIANKCFNGGASWVRLSYVCGLKKLGYKVFFLEQISAETCLDESGSRSTFERSVNLAYFQKIVDQFGLSDHSVLISDDGEQTSGIPYKDVLALAESSDLLINITGHLRLKPLLRSFRRKAYIDLDPGFTQFWHVAGETGPSLEGHDFYFTVGENIGMPGCNIPTGEISWRPTRPPVVLEQWPVSKGGLDRFTTIASWRGAYGPIQRGSKTFGLKVHEFRKFIELPRLISHHFEIALDIHSDEVRDLQLLRANNWTLSHPRIAAGDPSAFRGYVQASGAEFSVAQGIYVDTNSGWFSDRTVRYLASGKPVLVQDTGFNRNYPAGEGLVCFRTVPEAIDGAHRIARDYETHCRAARQLAEQHFDSDKVLNRLMEDIGVAP
jgi:hypothetical protein